MPKGFLTPLSQILVENSYYQSNKLRIRLLKAGIKSYKCEVCNNSVWNNKPIPLELDHINGINTDNRLENLRFICPNCHAQTDSYRGKNHGKASKKHHYAHLSQSAEETDLKSVKSEFESQDGHQS